VGLVAGCEVALTRAAMCFYIPRLPYDRNASPGGERRGMEANNRLLARHFPFLACRKNWWLVPVLVLLALVGFLMALSASPVTPFLYTLF
jgi:hypothetical protein